MTAPEDRRQDDSSASRTADSPADPAPVATALPGTAPTDEEPVADGAVAVAVAPASDGVEPLYPDPATLNDSTPFGSTEATASGAPALSTGTPAGTVDEQAVADVSPEHSAFAALELDEEQASPRAEWADEARSATALTWVDESAVADAAPTVGLDAPDPDAAGASLFRGARLRSTAAGPGVLVPVGVLVALVAGYAGTTLLWPLHEVPPTVSAVEFTTTPAAAAAVAWPAQGSAAVGVQGIGTVASSTDQAVIASITKVVSALMVLDRMPLAVGEQGPEFSFTRADNRAYWNYKRQDQSALDVPVGGSLTEYQMLQGVLLGSANNYIDRLAKEIWGSDRAFADAAQTWLRERGITGMTIATPSGFDERNTATPAALIAVAEKALQNPVFAEIVGTPSVELPGAGVVTNTNGMLADPGVVGLKTGTLHESWNLLTAKDVTVDGTTVRLFASVLTQEDDDMRLEATRSLFSQVEAALQGQAPAVPRGTVVGSVSTPWGAKADIVTDADADVVLWNSATATATSTFDLGEHRAAGAEVGTLTTSGPLNTVTTPLTLAQKIDGPSAWWRLTHPLELLGLTDASR